MNTQEQKCKRIKNLIQSISGIKDIGLRSRKQHHIELKKIYCKLCKEFTSAPLCAISEILGNYHHTTALHAINSFNDLYQTNGLHNHELYEEAKKRLKEEKYAISIKQTPETIIELHQKHRISLIKIIDKSHSIINRKEDRIKKIESFLEELLELTDPANPKERNDFSKYFSLRSKINSFILKK